MQNIQSTKLTDFKEKFQSLDKHELESFIKGILLSCQREQRQDRKVFEYTLFPLGKLCRKAFCHPISKLNGIYSRDNDTLNINVETFRKYFKLYETIKIKSGKSDVCDTCTLFESN
eukprot:NODE_51_length_27121_cov_0.309452.p18 type:complete len:116 gc:universal NODE_51_length_27121_cov_0.309452:19699-20046(+)